MAEQAQKKGNLAIRKEETFNVPGQGGDGKKVVLNIQDSKEQGILLDKNQTRKFKKSGNFLVDWYNAVNNYLIEHSAVSVRAKATFFHLLSVMLNSGVPMVQALISLAEQTEDSPRLKKIISQIAIDIEEGGSLSEAMLVYQDVFSEQEVGMVQSGEAAGRLVQVLESLAHNTEKLHNIRSKVRSAMMYPLVIMLLLVAVIVAMMVFVVPKLKELFTSTGNELPTLTRVVVGISNFMVEHGLLLLLIIFLIVLLLMVFKRTDTGKFYFDNMKLRLPVFGKLFQKSYLSRLTRSLSNLLDSGVSIVKTFEITANSMGNEVYRRRLLMAAEDIKQGIPLADNFSESNLFPPMMVSMIDVGEKTAQLGEITEKIADFYEAEVDTAVEGLSKILEPLILIVIGVTVGTVVAAIMLPIMQLSDLAGSL